MCCVYVGLVFYCGFFGGDVVVLDCCGSVVEDEVDGVKDCVVLVKLVVVVNVEGVWIVIEGVLIEGGLVGVYLYCDGLMVFRFCCVVDLDIFG